MMELRTFAIPPGSAETIALSSPGRVTVLMTDGDDVLWLSGAEGPLDTDAAVRLDKSQCPLTLSETALLVLHSPAQAGRTIQVSVVIGGAA